MADDSRNDAESDDAGAEAGESVETELERTRRLILERRNRFMAAALAGIGMAGGQACTRSSVCLSAPALAGTDAAGQTGGGSGGTTADGFCPGRPQQRPPCVCLSAPFGGTVAPPPIGGTVAPPTGGTGGTGGTRPNVCLSAPIDAGTGGSGGTRPSVCLEPPIDNDAGTEFEP